MRFKIRFMLLLLFLNYSCNRSKEKNINFDPKVFIETVESNELHEKYKGQYISPIERRQNKSIVVLSMSPPIKYLVWGFNKDNQDQFQCQGIEGDSVCLNKKDVYEQLKELDYNNILSIKSDDNNLHFYTKYKSEEKRIIMVRCDGGCDTARLKRKNKFIGNTLEVISDNWCLYKLKTLMEYETFP